jgi:hypothetical protein
VRVGYGAKTGLSGSLKPGAEVSIVARSETGNGHAESYLRHKVNNGKRSVIAAPIGPHGSQEDRQAATWIVRRGLAKSDCVSFESRDRPGEFIRHYNYVLYVAPYNGSATMAGDATFCPVSALSGTSAEPGEGSATSSLRSFNFPDRYLRTYYSQGYIASATGSARFQDGGKTFKEDATFTIVDPLAP